MAIAQEIITGQGRFAEWNLVNVDTHSRLHTQHVDVDVLHCSLLSVQSFLQLLQPQLHLLVTGTGDGLNPLIAIGFAGGAYSLAKTVLEFWEENRFVNRVAIFN